MTDTEEYLETMDDDAQHAEFSQTMETQPPLAPSVMEYIRGGSPFDADSSTFARTVNNRAKNHQLVHRLVMETLVEGVDYGKIHVVKKTSCKYLSAYQECTIPGHWSKPCLFKGGAEKVAILLGLAPRYPMLSELEARISDGWEPKQIVLRCELIDSAGRVFAEGVGARTLAQDYGDLNKTLKMAEKSAMIDAAIRVSGLSAWFTQDLDDMPKIDPLGKEPSPPPPKPRQPTDKTLKMAEKKAYRQVAEELNQRITGKQVIRLEARITTLGLDRDRVKAFMKKACGVEHFSYLTPTQYDKLDRKLEDLAAAQRREASKYRPSEQPQPTPASSVAAPDPDSAQAQPLGRSTAQQEAKDQLKKLL